MLARYCDQDILLEDGGQERGLMLRAFASCKPPFAAMYTNDRSRILALDALSSSAQCWVGFAYSLGESSRATLAFVLG